MLLFFLAKFPSERVTFNFPLLQRPLQLLLLRTRLYRPSQLRPCASSFFSNSCLRRLADLRYLALSQRMDLVLLRARPLCCVSQEVLRPLQRLQESVDPLVRLRELLVVLSLQSRQLFLLLELLLNIVRTNSTYASVLHNGDALHGPVVPWISKTVGHWVVRSYVLLLLIQLVVLLVQRLLLVCLPLLLFFDLLLPPRAQSAQLSRSSFRFQSQRVLLRSPLTGLLDLRISSLSRLLHALVAVVDSTHQGATLVLLPLRERATVGRHVCGHRLFFRAKGAQIAYLKLRVRPRLPAISIAKLMARIRVLNFVRAFKWWWK